MSETVARNLFSQDQMAQLVGAKFLQFSNGCVELEMQITGNIVQAHGTCQGGALFTLADAVFGISASCSGQAAVSQHCMITYLQPAHVGETVRAKVSKTTKSGRTSIYDVVLLSQSNEVIAEFRGVARDIGRA